MTSSLDESGEQFERLMDNAPLAYIRLIQQIAQLQADFELAGVTVEACSECGQLGLLNGQARDLEFGSTCGECESWFCEDHRLEHAERCEGRHCCDKDWVAECTVCDLQLCVEHALGHSCCEEVKRSQSAPSIKY